MTVKIENLQKLEPVDVVELTDEELSRVSGGQTGEPIYRVGQYAIDELLELIGS